MIGLGSKFWYETAEGSGVFAELDACITNMARGGGSVAVVEDGCMRSPGGFKEKDPGEADEGQWTIDLNLDFDAYVLLKGLVRSKRQFRIEYPENDDGEVLYETFDGFIVSWTVDDPWNEKITQTFVFEVSGEAELEIVSA